MGGECHVTWFLTLTGGHIAAGREVGGGAEVSEGGGAPGSWMKGRCSPACREGEREKEN